MWLLNLLYKIGEAFEEFVLALFPRPDYEVPVNTLPMNQETPPETPKIAPETTKEPEPISAAEKLKITALAWLGKDASPNNLAKPELACAETVTFLVNATWPGTLDERIVGTDALFFALKRSKRFKGVLDPVPGCIEVSPRTSTVHGHAGIYVGADEIASNDSKDGKFRINYTRQSWRDTFIKGRGLKAYLFVPVDLEVV